MGMEYRSDAYVGTIRLDNGKPASEVDQFFLEQAKALAKSKGKNFYVKMQGRLGKNNPNAIKYRSGQYPLHYTYQCIRLADAATADVYIYQR